MYIQIVRLDNGENPVSPRAYKRPHKYMIPPSVLHESLVDTGVN